MLLALVFLLLSGCALAGKNEPGAQIVVQGQGPADHAASLAAGPSTPLPPGSLPAGKGEILLAVRWPARYGVQVIPETATRVLFEAKQSETVAASASVNRPAAGTTATASLELDAGSYTLAAAALALDRPVATGSTPLTVLAGVRTSASLTLAEAAIAYQVATLAGGAFRNGASDSARFNAPAGLAIDGEGNVYVADRYYHRIRKITPGGDVTTLAGDGTVGFADGQGGAARFNYPTGVAVDSAGNIHVADRFNHRIRKITSAGAVTTVAGDGTAGFEDGEGPAARFNGPFGVAVDGAGNVYVADTYNNRIRKITSSGVVSTLAGDGSPDFADGTGTVARFKYPYGVTVDAAGNVYVADQSNLRIRKISSAGSVTTLAGDGTAGFADGAGATARFSYPDGVAVDGAGNVYVADTNNQRIRKVNSAGAVTTLAGDGTAGFADGDGAAARFIFPIGVAVDVAGNVFVADYNHRVRKVTPEGVASTLAGTEFADGVGAAARFNSPFGVAVDGAGNAYVADYYNQRIRKITSAGDVTTVAGDGTANYADGGGAAARFNGPHGVAVDSVGNLYVGDYNNQRIRKISSAGDVTTLAGDGTADFADGIGTAARFNGPAGVEVDGAGNVYVADYRNHRIRKISTAGVVTTLAGDGTADFADGAGAAARFKYPNDVAVDGAGNVYVADYSNHRIRKITSAGVVTTLAGDGTAGFADGEGAAARFNGPSGVEVDAAGNVYVVDYSNHQIRKITSSGAVTTLAGDGTAGFSDGATPAARFQYPSAVAVDAGLQIYVADTYNHAIRTLR